MLKVAAELALGAAPSSVRALTAVLLCLACLDRLLCFKCLAY